MIALVNILAFHDNLMCCLWVVHVFFSFLQPEPRHQTLLLKQRPNLQRPNGKTRLTIHHWEIALKDVLTKKRWLTTYSMFIHFRVLFLRPNYILMYQGWYTGPAPTLTSLICGASRASWGVSDGGSISPFPTSSGDGNHDGAFCVYVDHVRIPIPLKY